MSQGMAAFTGDLAWLYLLAFLRPLAEAIMVMAGEWCFHARFRTSASYQRLIVQITTVGREHARVCEIIDRIRSYRLPMDHEVWVTMEPGHRTDYPAADRVIVVPEGFTCRASHKARAQEYARRVRQQLGLDRDPALKILFLDDDVEPTRQYVLTGFAGDYDVCQGITSPRVHYGGQGFKHWLLSHMDDMRFLACFVWCGFTQGVVKRPVYAHGEGLFMTAHAERITTWDYPVFASEDLVVGQNAAQLGLRWGWFHEYVELTSPWSWGDFVKQRRRWLWGNIHAISHAGVLPTWGRVLVAGKYLLGIATFGLSFAGIVLLLIGVTRFTPMAYVFCWGAFVSWVIAFGVSGWVNGGRRVPEDDRSRVAFILNRMWQAFSAVLLAVTLVTPMWTALAMLIALLRGNPRGFEVIRKTATTVDVDRPVTA
jgi:Glycosyl transferase family group 2